MSRFTLSRQNSWLDQIALQNISFSTLFSEQVSLVSGDGFSVPIPATFLLASSTLLTEVYLPNVLGQDIFLPSVRGETLLLVAELLRTGTTGGIEGVENTGHRLKEVQGVMDLLQTGVNVMLKSVKQVVINVKSTIEENSLHIIQVCSKAIGNREATHSPLLDDKVVGLKPLFNPFVKVNVQRLPMKIVEKDHKVSMEETNQNNNSDHVLPSTNVSCHVCEENFTKKNILRKHLRTKHPENTYQCPDCDLHFIHQRSVNKHKEIVHKGFRYQCVQCECNFTSKYSLNCHMRRKHEDNQVQEHEDKPISLVHPVQCLKCEKNFSNIDNMKRHYAVIHEGMRFSCEECDFMSGAKQRVVKHCLRSQHDPEKIKTVYTKVDDDA